MSKSHGNFEVAQDNIVAATMEDLSPEDQAKYSALQEAFQELLKNEYLKTFRKGREDRPATQALSLIHI